MDENLNLVLDELLSSVDLKEVNASSTGGYEELPEGYYLCELEEGSLGVSQSSGNNQVKLQFKVVEDGFGAVVDEKGNSVLKQLAHTSNRKIFKYYPLKDEKTVKRFVSDMLKFEGEEPDVPFLGKEYFTNGEILQEALSVLSGMRIYIQAQKPTKEGTTGNFYNLISWKRARALELPL